MNTITKLLAITGSALIIASCQDFNNESDAAATEHSAVDTVPKGRTDSMMNMPKGRTDSMLNKPDTNISGMVAPRYLDLNTGQTVDLYYDAKRNRVYSMATNEPVDFYVDMSTGDTIYGTGRYIVNNYIIKSPEGQYRLDMNKVKMEKNEWKIKEGNRKFKMDKSEMKIKGDTTGEKMYGDTTRRGKMKSSDMKMKGDTTSGKMKMKTKKY